MQTNNNESVKHTPGEWNFELARWAANGPVQGFIITCNGKDIAACNVSTKTNIYTDSVMEQFNMNRDEFLTDCETEANAAYICKAVNNYETLLNSHRELLEVLEFTTKLISICIDTEKVVSQRNALTDINNLAFTAIERANILTD